jgi:type I restriction enzyme S subunit
MKNWEKKRLIEICSKITDGSHNPPKGISTSDFLMLSSKNIFDDLIHYEDPRYLTEKDFEAENKRTQVESNDVLLTIVGTIGRVAVVPAIHPKFTLQRSVAVLKVNKNVLESRFLMFSLQNILKYLTDEARGVAQKGIYLNQLKDIEIPLPPLPEQQRIVSILDEAFAAIAKAKANAEQNLLNAKELFESYLQGVFEKKGDGWEIKKLGDICSIQLGKTPYRKNPKFWDKKKLSGNVWLSISDLKHGEYISESAEQVTDLGAKEIVKIPKGTMLLSFKLTLGRVSFAGTDLYTNEAIAALLNLNIKISKDFLFYYFSLFDWDKAAEGDVKVKGKTLNKQKLKELQIPLPQLSEQQTIVRQLDALRAETQKLEAVYQKKIDDLEELKKSILQKAFAGELKMKKAIVI